MSKYSLSVNYHITFLSINSIFHSSEAFCSVPISERESVPSRGRIPGSQTGDIGSNPARCITSYCKEMNMMPVIDMATTEQNISENGPPENSILNTTLIIPKHLINKSSVYLPHQK